MIKAIIFDLDDTLYNEEDFIFGGLKAASKLFEDSEKTYNFFLKTYLNEGRDKLFNKYLDTLNISNKGKKILLKKMIKEYRFHKPELKPYIFFKKFITKYYTDYFFILLTDGHTKVQKNKFEALGIRKYFKLEIYTGINLERHKPAQWSYYKILEKTKLNPNEFLCVGDNPHKDFITPNRMGMHTLRVRKGRFKNLNKPYDAKFFINDLSGNFLSKINEIEKRVIK